MKKEFFQKDFNFEIMIILLIDSYALFIYLFSKFDGMLRYAYRPMFFSRNPACPRLWTCFYKLPHGYYHSDYVSKLWFEILEMIFEMPASFCFLFDTRDVLPGHL